MKKIIYDGIHEYKIIGNFDEKVINSEKLMNFIYYDLKKGVQWANGGIDKNGNIVFTDSLE